MCCYKNYQHKFNEKLKKRFFNAYKFSNHGNCKFVLLLQKVVYPYEYMHDWEQLNETLLPEKKKKGFYSHSNMEDITEADNKQAKGVHKDFVIKHLGEIIPLNLMKIS